jgi:hypothetical protein
VSSGAAVSGAESGSGSESLGSQATLSPLDSGSGIDVVNSQGIFDSTIFDASIFDAAGVGICVQVSAGDLGSGVDSAAIQAILVLFERGFGVDSAFVQALVSALDSGVGVDQAKKGQVYVFKVQLQPRGNGAPVVLRGDGVPVVLRGDGAPVKAQ